jgi:hypothetical protein
MNPIGQLITFLASVSIIAYFLILGYYLRRIMIAVEKLAVTHQSKIVVCDNCGKQINLGVGFRGTSAICPICKSHIAVEQPGLILHTTPKEKIF